MDEVLRVSDRVYWTVTCTVPNHLLRLGLTCIQLKVLLALSNGTALRMVDLASDLGKNKKAMTGIVDRLVARGMLVRTYDDNDRRVVLCKLSEKGVAAVKEIFELQDIGRTRMRSFLKEMPDEELHNLATALREAYRHFRKGSEV